MPATAPPDIGDRPSDAMGLLLRAAVGRPDQAGPAWSAWLDRVDIEHLEGGATELLSLVGRNLGDLGDLGAPPSVVGRVRGVHRQTWARNRLCWAAAAPLVDRLGAVAQVPLVLPAASLVPLYGGDWGVRPLHRVELALHTAATDAARAALADSGWSVDHLTPALVARTRAAREERWQARDASGNWVSIRWRVLPRIPSVAADEQLHGSAARVPFESSVVHLLHPADALLERLWAGPRPGDAGWFADVVQLARGVGGEHGGGRDRRRVAERAQRLGIVPVVRARLALAASVVPDPEVTLVLEALQRARPGAVAALWRAPEPASRLGRAWAGHAAGQGIARGARSLLRARRAVHQLRRTAPVGAPPASGADRGSAHRR